MANTAGQSGSRDTRTFIEILSSTPATELMAILNVCDVASHQSAIELMDNLMDEIGDVPVHPAHPFMNLLAGAIARYEEKIYPPVFAGLSPPDKTVAVLKYLMSAHNVKQSELEDIFASQGNVSQVLNGKRGVTVDQIRKLAERFHVDPSVFL